MKVIAVANQKGGCGKTITAVNLAYVLSGSGKKVLFIDLDPQSHATYAFGIKITDPSKSSYAIFETFLKGNNTSFTSLFYNKSKNLAVIPSNITLSTIEQKISGTRNAALILANSIKAGYTSEWEYIIIDTPPNLGFLTLNAILASHHLIIPVDVSLFSLNGVIQIDEILNTTLSMGFEKPRMNFLITQFDCRSNFAKTFISKAKELFGDKLFKTVIRSNIKLRESVYVGKSVFEYAPQANGALDYTSLAREIEPEVDSKRPIRLKSEVPDNGKLQTLFKLYAPTAQKVYVTGTFNDWAVNNDYVLKKLDNGMWVKIVSLPEGTYHYKFVVDGEWIEDPGNTMAENDMLGGKNSVLLVKTP